MRSRDAEAHRRKGHRACKARARKGKNILSENRDKLDKLAQFLYERETITGEEFMDILNADSDKQKQ